MRKMGYYEMGTWREENRERDRAGVHKILNYGRKTYRIEENERWMTTRRNGQIWRKWIIQQNEMLEKNEREREKEKMVEKDRE